MPLPIGWQPPVFPLPPGSQPPSHLAQAIHLRHVWVLNAKGRGITDLTGLEHCYNLGEATLSNNAIQDVSPLAACRNLQLLDLAHNQISDVSPLGKIEKLQYLRNA
jgi:Leucine-rich repeat (LRR) protein